MSLRNRTFGRQRNVFAFGLKPSTRLYRMGSAKHADMGHLIHEEQATKRIIKVLDTGCGDGKRILYARHSSIEFTGFDVFVHTSAESARSRGYAKLQEGNVCGQQLPFTDGSFDVVVCSHILEHLPDPERLVGEALRMLRPGGLLIVGVPMHTKWTRLLRVHVAPIFIPRKRHAVLAANFGHVQFFTMPSLFALLRDFRIEDCRGFYFLSDGSVLPVENWHWWYRLNLLWGKTLPGLTAEVNVACRVTSKVASGGP